MGAVMKLIDATLFIFFALVAVIIPLINGQICLPQDMFPKFLLDLNTWYAKEYGDYLATEKPHFVFGLVWFKLLLQWPLAIASAFAIAASKSWISTTCLLYGASSLTSMVAVLSEFTWSGRASDQLLMMCFTFLGFSLLSLLRGLLPLSSETVTMGKRPATNRKKRA